MEIIINQSSNHLTLDPVLKNRYNGGTEVLPLIQEPDTIAVSPNIDLSRKAHFSVSFLSRSSSIAMIGGLLSQGLKFLVIVYVARQFSVSEFGLLSFAWAVYAYQFVVCNSGLQFFGSRAVAKTGHVSGALLAEICFLRVILALVGTAGSLLVLALLPHVSRTELLLVAVFGLSNLPLAAFFDWAFQGIHRQEVSAILNVILQGLWFVLSAWGIRLGMGISAVPAALVVATLIASLVGYVWLKRTDSPAAIDAQQPGVLLRSWETLRSATPLGLGLWLNTVLTWSDAIIVRLVQGEQAVGWYAAGNRAGLALAMLASYYVQGAFPLLSRSSHEGLAQFRLFFQHCYQDIALVFVPGSIWTIFYAREIVLLLFKKPEYLAAVPVFQIFQIVFLVTALGNLYGLGALVAFNHDREYRGVFVLAVIVFIPLCVVLAHYSGALGAAAAVLLTQVIALLLFVKSSRGLVEAQHSAALALPVGLGVCVGIVSKLLGLALLWSAVLMAITYAVILAGRLRIGYLREKLS